MTSRINNLVDRYTQLYPAEPVPIKELADVEALLSIVLPGDLRDISTVYAGGILGSVSQFDIGSTYRDYSITRMTITYRKTIGLPINYIALAEPDNGLIIMQTRFDASLPSPILWIDAIDSGNISSGEFVAPPQRFGDYAEYFEFLLDNE